MIDHMHESSFGWQTAAIVFSLTLLFTSLPARGQGVAGEGFPIGNYTPFGYLDNPYHTLWLNYSGVIRTAPPLGFRFRQHETVHQMAIAVNGTSYAYPEDFSDADLHSAYHSKNLFTYDWLIDGVEFTAAYFLESDSARGLNVEVTMRNTGSAPADVTLRAALFLPPLDLDSYTARVQVDGGVIVQRYAAGPVYLLHPENADGYFAVSDSAGAVEGFLATGNRDALSDWDSDVAANFMGGVMAFDAELAPGSEERFRWVLARDVARPLAERLARNALATFDARRIALIRDDEDFWEDVPRLTGDWPETWKKGLVYDWETLRMNVRRPIGRYHHHWDGMQVMIPRSVLAETAIDMFAYSFAQPEMAKEVLYGIFADALAPNVPCMREDGSVNMVSESGEESGTAPSWCIPSLAIRSIYARTRDNAWASELYPHLEDYVIWWLGHRMNPDSTMFFDNSWESGQDESSRFLVKHRTGGTGVRHMEPVELHASMADFADLLDGWADRLDRNEHRDWHALFDQYRAVTNSHWVDGRFRDFDRRTDEYTDVLIDYHWMPFVFDLTTEAQEEAFRSFAVRDTLGRFRGPAGGAPHVQVTTEVLWQVGERALQAQLISETLDHVYTQWDRRTWETPDALPRVWGHVDRPSVLLEYHPRTWAPIAGRIDNATNSGAPSRPEFVPMPGVASEFWMDRQGRPVGMENYGWGATMPMHLIRGIIGYRDLRDESPGFLLAPSIPEHLLVTGHELGMANLHFGGLDFDVVYRVLDDDELEAVLTWRAPETVGVQVVDAAKVLTRTASPSTTGTLRFRVANYEDVEIRFAE